jgi:hypothetical protein
MPSGQWRWKRVDLSTIMYALRAMIVGACGIFYNSVCPPGKDHWTCMNVSLNRNHCPEGIRYCGIGRTIPPIHHLLSYTMPSGQRSWRRMDLSTIAYALRAMMVGACGFVYNSVCPPGNGGGSVLVIIQKHMPSGQRSLDMHECIIKPESLPGGHTVLWHRA